MSFEKYFIYRVSQNKQPLVSLLVVIKFFFTLCPYGFFRTKFHCMNYLQHGDFAAEDDISLIISLFFRFLRSVGTSFEEHK